MPSSLSSIASTAAATCTKSSSTVSTLLAIAVYCLIESLYFAPNNDEYKEDHQKLPLSGYSAQMSMLEFLISTEPDVGYRELRRNVPFLTVADPGPREIGVSLVRNMRGTGPYHAAEVHVGKLLD